MDSSEFNAVLLSISEQLSKEQLQSMVFLCKGIITKKDSEKIDTGLKLFTLLMERAKLGVDNTDFLCEKLEQIHRPDLAAKIHPSAEQCHGENAKLNIASDVIVNNVGKSWRKFGRKLGLTEVHLESIAKKHPTDLMETVVEVLKMWRKIKPEEGENELIKALRDCDLNLTADKVEEKLKDQ
ncbi:FAS-associated death domain protein [Nelusetta ayraudi]|uniref:FAS-associated death domain protein n=1 Tax=Nelusetta ayraudi TaxID=303726 RepID=UPI003F6FA30A